MQSDVADQVGTKAGTSQYHEAGLSFHIKAGMDVTIEAGLSLTLMVGGNYIKIDPAGIQIEGLPLVTVNCSIPATPAPPPMQFKSPEQVTNYKGPHATRYKRSFQK
jgi:type VI secretion system secreted protein VgrG